MTRIALIAVFLGCAMSVSCRSSLNDGTGGGAQPVLALEVVGGDAGVSITADADGNARLLGEITNSGTATGCFISLSIDSFDANGQSNGGQSFDFLFGETFQFTQFFGFGAATYHTCLGAGATGSFDLRTTIPAGQIASVETHPSCQGDETAACLPQGGGAFFMPPVLLQMVNGSLTETTDVTGHTMYTGTIMNNRPAIEVSSVATDVRVVFTAKNRSGRVVDVVCMNRDGTLCSPMSFSSATLGPQERWNFQVALSIQPSQTCPGCFSYSLNYTPQI